MGQIVLNSTFEITDEDIDNIITTAVEGGIGYWSKVKSVSTYIKEMEAHHSVTLYPYLDPNDFDPQTLLPAAILKGIKMWCEWQKKTPADLFHPDFGDFDAGTADCIIQFALFGELVFG
jgi:hypothetical protein